MANIFRVGYGGTIFYADIVVTAPTGSTVTATLGDKVYSASEVSGKWTFRVRKKGTYTIKAVKGSQSATASVAVTTKKTYTATLTYVTYVTYRIRGTGTYNGEVAASADGYTVPGSHSVASGSTIPLTIKTTTGGVGEIKVNGTIVKRTGVGANMYTATYNLKIANSGTEIYLSVEGSSRGVTGFINVTNASTTSLALENDHMAVALSDLGVDTGGQSTAETVEEALDEQDMLIAALETLGVDTTEETEEDNEE